MSERSNEFGQPIGPPLPNWVFPPPPQRMPLTGRFCRLEPLTPEAHAPALYAGYGPQGPQSWTYLPYGPFPAFGPFNQWIESVAGGPDPHFFAIIELTTGRPSGLASYLRIAPAAGSIEVGHIHFCDNLKQTPAATEAMYLMMRWAFEAGYRRYEWKCDTLNAASRRAAVRLGFTYEGTFRQATVYKGRSRDTAWYSVIDAEWPQLRVAFETWLSPANFDERGRQRARLADLT